ncbi:MAG: 16S rRNA (guanine(527)-N(7))-methyltransferase RsmG [Candidatus Gracilibacteria bacterium]|nr:16S rRNA (guanine(527)-N(7))-methyltransferase RsmG [Candidatus Gracilibacteria bacterium]
MKETFKAYDISLSDIEYELFDKFLPLFIERNSLVNLSAIRDEQGITQKHFIDSIILNKFIKLHGNVLDIGSGGGFPGIPLKITNPEVNFTLLDSIGKKVNSMNIFIEKLSLSGIKAIQARAEEIGNKEDFSKRYDFIVSRATAYLPKIIEWSFPFLKEGGKMIIFKLNNKEELKDGEFLLKKLKLKITNIHKYDIEDQERILIEISR